jgi:hypothetical protein
MIRIDRERYIKHMVTDLETPTEPLSTDFPILGNYFYESYFENFPPLLSDVPLTQNYELILKEKSPISTEDTLFCQNSALEIVKQEAREQ